MKPSRAHSRIMVIRPLRTGLTVIEIAVIVIVILALVALILPAVQQAKNASYRSQCKANLKQISLALLNYHETYGSFPPAYVSDKEGRPLYSWRVLILPFLDAEDVYERFHLDEPWDSPHNRSVVDGETAPLSLMSCPSDAKQAKQSEREPVRGITNFLAVVGPETVWPAPDVCRLEEVSDGTPNTLLVVEVANSGIHWAEPRDLHVTQMAPEVNPKAGMGLSSRHAGGTHVVFVDGTVWYISDDTPPETLQALLTRAGGEAIDDF